MTPETLSTIRSFMKEFQAHSPDEAHQEEADTVNKLIPQIVDALTDEELTQMMHQIFQYVLINIITVATEQPLEENKGQN